MVQFILNDKLVSASQSEGSTVLDYVRYFKRLAGTKIGCREGDCGACTMLVGDFENGQLVYRSATSCLMPLGNAQGKHIVTVEGINMKQLSPVQQAMVDTNGTQCGFCTLGFVMSFTGFVLHSSAKEYPEAIAAIDGNICRCTGYKSIERSADVISKKLSGKPTENTIDWLVDNEFIPAYFKDIEQRLKDLSGTLSGKISLNGNGASKLMLGGGTDLIVQRATIVKKSNVELLYDAKELKGIYTQRDEIHIGASVTVSEFMESSIIQEVFPELKKHIKLVSSTPIRNMATLAGNFVNASPIGDMSIYFLALDSSVVLNNTGSRRTVKLKDFFKAYKQVDKVAGEHIEKIIFNKPPATTLFNFEKVSKRTHLDIASVNSACQLTTAGDQITSIHLSAGGVAPFPKYLNNTCSFLIGKQLTTDVINQAINIMQEEVAPISDARGSEQYKRLLLRQLFLAHIYKFAGDIQPLKNILLR
jgi:xanthine dehydrogenase small subunit